MLARVKLEPLREKSVAYLDIAQRGENCHEVNTPGIIKSQVRQEIHNLGVHLL